jgi:hypothetical protein
MENLDLREILKDVPRGTKLYSTAHGYVEFETINSNDSFPIACHKAGIQLCLFTKEGKYYTYDDGECILFPSKENKDWSQFKVPCQFKIGDIIYHEHDDLISIYKGDGHRFDVGYYTKEKLSYVITNLNTFVKIDNSNYRLATNAEKELFYNELQNKGYFWNDEINSLEKYKFKVGDRIQNINSKNKYKIININHDYYILERNSILDCDKQNNFETIKFDLSTLKPYDKVLVRRQDIDQWEPQLFSCLNNDTSGYYYKTILVGSFSIKQCIPYEGNEHLTGTTNNCDEYYKTWE